MEARQIDDAWALLDRTYLESVARRGPEPVFATVSGAHLYGFASPDSDVDLRGAVLLPAREVLGLEVARETVIVEETSPGHLDWVAHDVRKFARMMIRHNGYVLEQLFSPLIVVTTPAHEDLRELGRGCVTRGTLRHYQGFARGRRERLREPGATIKDLLYAYRVLLTGIHLMRTGEVVANINDLNHRFELKPVDELVERKRAAAEKQLLGEGELAAHERTLDRLETDLIDAHDRSSLPEEPTTVAALDDLVVGLRLDSVRQAC